MLVFEALFWSLKNDLFRHDIPAESSMEISQAAKLLTNHYVYYLDGNQSSLIWIPYKLINAASIACYQNCKASKLQFSKHLKNKFYLGFNSTEYWFN